MRLQGKIAIVTGAGSGMGKSAALLFAAEGAKVAVVDINGGSAEVTAGEIKASGARAIALTADVSKSADTALMVEATVSQLGLPTVLYNNAGIEGESGWIAQLPEEAFDKVIAINLRGVYLGMKYTLPQMIKAGGGAIINTASIAGMVAIKGSSAYCAAKAGVIALTRVAALEYARYNIRVNCICPGVIDTPMVRRISGEEGVMPKALSRISLMGRAGTPEEVARMALFLASDEASFATGAPFIVDGGWTVS